jgi:nucleotide-binding universal stress UspA family protein
MTTHSPSNTGSIVVGVDSSAASEHAVLWAADEARLQHRALVVVHAQATMSTNQLAALGSAGIAPHQLESELGARATEIVERARSLASDRMRDGHVEAVVSRADPRSLLLELSSTAAMTVVGTRGHGPVAGLLLGSVSGALVRHATTPVAVVRAVQADARGVLIAVDGTDASAGPLEYAYAEASVHGLPLTVLHCHPDALGASMRWSEIDPSDPAGEDARVRVSESIAGMGEKFPEVDVQVVITQGAVDACLVDLSARYDLLVIGRPPSSLGQRLLLGGITTAVAEHAHSPVLVIP